MKTIYKYTLPVGDNVAVSLPVGAGILSVHEQREQICMWALVDPNEKETEIRQFRIAGTGHDITEDLYQFIGSVHMYSSSLVFHVFEVKG
jgi:hypothetical protein